MSVTFVQSSRILSDGNERKVIKNKRRKDVRINIFGPSGQRSGTLDDRTLRTSSAQELRLAKTLK